MKIFAAGGGKKKNARSWTNQKNFFVWREKEHTGKRNTMGGEHFSQGWKFQKKVKKKKQETAGFFDRRRKPRTGELSSSLYREKKTRGKEKKKWWENSATCPNYRRDSKT